PQQRGRRRAHPARTGLPAGTGGDTMSASLLPYAWARAQRAIVQRAGAQYLVQVSEQTPGWAVAELLREYAPAELRRVDDTSMQALLAEAYAQTGDAASVVGEAENDLDLDRLMQDIPEITDLLDATDGAPVIRMINALLTQ